MESQTRMIIERMRGRGITQLEAVQEPIYCTRLAARIADIKGMGYEVRDAWETRTTRDGKTSRYKRYWLVDDHERK